MNPLYLCTEVGSIILCYCTYCKYSYREFLTREFLTKEFKSKLDLKCVLILIIMFRVPLLTLKTDLHIGAKYIFSILFISYEVRMFNLV